MTKQEMLVLLDNKIHSCTLCPELVSHRMQPVLQSGNQEARILLLGEAPGADEDEQGEVFVGQAGKLLSNIIKASGLSRKNDVYFCNVIKCRPPRNRRPDPTETNNCSGFTKLQIKIINPLMILCLGNTAAQWLLKTSTPISQLRQRWFSYADGIVKADVTCSYHPSFLLRNPEAKKDFWDDLQLLLRKFYEQCAKPEEANNAVMKKIR